ncbi:hypothetical protein P3X46_028455 [Hevea brasiliensis]|uniref:Receptor-like serine/threonine-protein kinase n=1 Tax=Hevea brasiliensis TaxID=3981 RepID=A0ABQ9KQT8_HEVBR|nr:G-type lectin S-receptor-like serine/threonine-protein kinase LECRK3 [Hevea brasiliensis]KAJ9146151.1 hypothetical protein P3X46_028455 [Hevea brasiliensis]
MLLIFLLLSSIFCKAMAQHSIISPGSSLTPTNISYWSSESGHFAFGFYPQGDGFAIGIWLPRIQQATVIWTANRDDPPLSRNATLILNTEGKLILQQQGSEPKFIANIPKPASSASMLNSGNFVLYDSESKIIWQTFDAPTDTILPGQHLAAEEQLVSSISNKIHKSGRFALRMRRNGNLVMLALEYPLQSDYFYWKSQTANAGDNVTLNLDTNGLLYLLDTNGKNIRTLSDGRTIFDQAMYRATIDADGIFRLYSHDLDRYSNWSMEWQSSDNKCDPTGLCGSNAYCTVVDQVVACACPSGFDFIDQSQKNLGCQPNSSADDCLHIKESSQAFNELEGISWKAEPYSTLPSSTKEACRQECLKDCYCEAAVYGNQQCRKHKLPLRFGKAQEKPSMTTFIKARVVDLGMKTGGSNRKKELRTRGILIACTAISTLTSLALVIFGILFYRYRVWNYKKITSQGNDELFEDAILRSFAYDELKKATNNFEDEIGRGAFGTVYRGVISNGNRAVAIKRLGEVVAEGEREFRNEMKVIGRTHHKNLVRLFGYCHDGSNRLLVYEYMCNGSLADFLFRSEQKPAWEERIEMALNIARGIVYLHEECETQIIHCDIKPENILMDEKGSAKIADFGLSKLLMPNQSRTYTGIRGTRGYVAPEWHTNLPITVKVDVYSFGIMLLEIICCRRNVDMNVPDDQVVLANWVYDCFEANELDNLIQDEEVQEGKLERLVKVGLWCIQDEPSSRPSMKNVVLMLEGTIDMPDPPAPPSFSSSNNDTTGT